MNADEQVQIRRRNRLRHHYTMTSNVVLFGYRHLTDAEKITYQVVDSFDWSDGAGLRKGYAYPSVQTLAKLRGVNRRTIFRHFESLERVGLLRREPRAGRPTLLWIEEPSEAESEAYLSTITMRRDTDVTPTRDTDVTPSKKEETEEDKTPNGERSSGLGEGPVDESDAKREWLAAEMLNVLDGVLNVRRYRQVADSIAEHRIFTALSEVKLAAREGRIRKTKADLFFWLLRNEMR